MDAESDSSTNAETLDARSADEASERDASVDRADAGSKESASAEPADAGGDSKCRLVYGPAEQSFRGPAVLATNKKELSLVANEGGKPRVFSVPIPPVPPPGAPVIKPPKPSSFAAMYWPPCALAGKYAYCSKVGGNVQRTTLGGNDTVVVGKHRAGTRVSAASIDGEHAVVATLDSRRTTEGEVLQAFVTFDTNEPQRLSEDGAGATAVRLAARGKDVVAVYLDARMAMSPLHARNLSVKNHDLDIGNDAVLFVGGSPERSVDVSLVETNGHFFALVPHGRDAQDFGMAAIPVENPLKDDVPAVWSFYPNGLDPAPIASAPVERTGERVDAWIARVVPKTKDVGSPRMLELGRLAENGSFTSYGSIANADHVTDLSMAVDTYGAVWILYGDNASTWLERRVCR